MVKTTEIPMSDEAAISQKHYFKLMKNYLPCFSLSMMKMFHFRTKQTESKTLDPMPVTTECHYHL